MADTMTLVSPATPLPWPATHTTSTRKEVEPLLLLVQELVQLESRQGDEEQPLGKRTGSGVTPGSWH